MIRHAEEQIMDPLVGNRGGEAGSLRRLGECGEPTARLGRRGKARRLDEALSQRAGHARPRWPGRAATAAPHRPEA